MLLGINFSDLKIGELILRQKNVNKWPYISNDHFLCSFVFLLFDTLIVVTG